MKRLVYLAFFAGSTVPCAAEYAVGHTTMHVTAEGADRSVSLSVWYPTATIETDQIGGNAVFQGTPAAQDAPVLQGRFPLVVLSHGGLRSAADSGAWLSAALTRTGFVTVEVNAPRPARAADAVNEIWQRPADMSRALDQVLGDSDWRPRIDTTRLSAVGFALGGTAALSLAGGRIDPQAYAGYCDNTPEGTDCTWYQAQNVRLGSVETSGLSEMGGDPRFESVVAIAPEYLGVFSDDLASLEIPALHIALGSVSPRLYA
jgi:predicted dienelactone hydrolase